MVNIVILLSYIGITDGASMPPPSSHTASFPVRNQTRQDPESWFREMEDELRDFVASQAFWGVLEIFEASAVV
jgi:hypothetical protein